MRWFLALGAGFGSMVVCNAAAGQPQPVATQQQKICRAEAMPVRSCLIDLGDEARSAGNDAAACGFYRAADLISSSPGLALDIARCELAQGDADQAYRMAQRCIDDTTRAPASPSIAAKRVSCEELGANIRRSTGVLVVEWACTGDECGDITVDGTALPRSSWGISRRVKPGTYTVRAARGAKQVWEQRVTVEVEKTTSAKVPPSGPTVVPATSMVTKPASPESGWDGDVDLGPLSVGYRYRQLGANGYHSLTAGVEASLPGIGFGDRFQIRPYLMYRHEALDPIFSAFSLDSWQTATGIELDSGRIGLRFSHDLQLDERFRFVTGFGVGIGFSHLHSGDLDQPAGGVFTSLSQPTGFHADGAGITWELAATLGVLRRVGESAWLGFVVRTDGDGASWPQSVFSPDVLTDNRSLISYPRHAVLSVSLGFSVGLVLSLSPRAARRTVVASDVVPLAPASPLPPEVTPVTTASSPRADGTVRDFDKNAARSALAAAALKATQCKIPGGPIGEASVRVVFEPSGRVASANFEGPPFSGTTVGGCILSIFGSARVPAFDGSPVAVSKSVVIGTPGDDVY